MDHTGEILGTSDLNCFESAPSTNYLKECLNEGLVQKIHIHGAFWHFSSILMPNHIFEPSQATFVAPA